MLEYTREGTGFFLPFATDFEQCLTHFFDSEGLTGGKTDFLGRTSDKGPFMVVTPRFGYTTPRTRCCGTACLMINWGLAISTHSISV